MKNIILILISFIAFTASSQISFRTGNVQLDADLNIINTNASSNFSVFKRDLVVVYNVPEKKIDHMRLVLKLAPGEIYLVLEIFKIARKPIDEILKIYKKDKSKGWGYIAKQAGIKPGSPLFHQLKNNTSSRKNKKNKGKFKSKGNNKH